MKRKFVVAVISILTLTILLFAGCSNRAATANNTSKAITKDAQNITDSDLINSAQQDSSLQLEPLDTSTQQLSQSEIDTLLND